MPKAHGTRRMPVWGAWFSAEAVADSVYSGEKRPPPEEITRRIRRLVTYLETLQE